MIFLSSEQVRLAKVYFSCLIPRVKSNLELDLSAILYDTTEFLNIDNETYCLGDTVVGSGLIMFEIA